MQYALFRTQVRIILRVLLLTDSLPYAHNRRCRLAGFLNVESIDELQTFQSSSKCKNNYYNNNKLQNKNKNI